MAETPVGHRIPQPTRTAFLEAFVRTGTVSGAARAVGMDRKLPFRWLRDDPEYAQAFASARVEAIDTLEQAAIERARLGSDTLLIFLLKHLKPEVYRDRVEHAGFEGGPFVIQPLVAPAGLFLEGGRR